MFFISILNKVDDAVCAIEKSILVFCGLALTLIMMAQVILRYFFNSPIFWAEEISVQFLIFITVFGLSYLTKTKQHISIDFLLALISDNSKKALTLVVNVLFLILMCFLCFYSWEWVLRPDVQMEMSGTTGLPRWYTYIVFPIGITLLCWHQLVILINSFVVNKKEGLPC